MSGTRLSRLFIKGAMDALFSESAPHMFEYFGPRRPECVRTWRKEGCALGERLCEICRRSIPKERLSALPETRRCVECARKNGSGLSPRRVEIGMDVETYKDLLRATRT